MTYGKKKIKKTNSSSNRKKKKTRVQYAPVVPIRLVDRGYRDWEWTNQFYVYDLYVGNDRVEIEYDTTVRESPWRVIWEGAVDFEGNKKEMLARYPEFKRIVN